jgi:hypothetical protein
VTATCTAIRGIAVGTTRKAAGTVTRDSPWERTVLVIRQVAGQGTPVVVREAADETAEETAGEVAEEMADDVAPIVPREIPGEAASGITGIAMGEV